MSDDDRSARSAATGVGGVLLAVILLNVLLRVVPLPELDPPSVSLPDLPAWVDAGVDVIHTIVRVKNWLLAGVVAVIVVGVMLEQLAKRRRQG